MTGQVELGCGLIAIGRPWGTTPEVPSEIEALRFLDSAYELGIRTFDTAPAYGLSEQRLGTFLHGLTPRERNEITVCTKFGEYWDPESEAGYVDHSEETAITSIDRSLQLLGHISVLQVHKMSQSVIGLESVDTALQYAREQGIASLGASASDVRTAQLIIDDGRFDYVQVPYNQASPQFRAPIEMAAQKGIRLITNRPFQMGDITREAAADKHAAAVAAFRYILETHFSGVVLTGTSNIEHLKENFAAFHEA